MADAAGRRRVVPLMGTVFTFDLRDPGLSDGAVDRTIGWLQDTEATFSTYRSHSDIRRLGRGEVTVSECSPAVAEVLDICASLERETDGYFSANWNGLVDPTGLVKGWSVEAASAMLRDAGSRSHAINGGGDVRTVGDAAPGERWHIGVADPFGKDQFITAVTGSDLAVATSGIGERGDHILDPHDQAANPAWASVTVVGPDLTFADAYATAAMAMGHSAVRWLTAARHYEAFFVDRNGRTTWTPGYAHHVLPQFALPEVAAAG